MLWIRFIPEYVSGWLRLATALTVKSSAKAERSLPSFTRPARDCTKKASRFIRAAGSLADDSFSADCACVDFDKAAEFAERLCDKFLGKKSRERKTKKSLSFGHNAKKGLVTFSKTPPKAVPTGRCHRGRFRRSVVGHHVGYRGEGAPSRA